MAWQKPQYGKKKANGDYLRVTQMFPSKSGNGKRMFSVTLTEEYAIKFLEYMGDLVENGKMVRLSLFDNGAEPWVLTCGEGKDREGYQPKKGASYPKSKSGYTPYKKKEEVIMDDPLDTEVDGYEVE